ncbi:MAG: hypothetical protein IPO83_07345 [Chitinophagaceae bacterium]|nr:hypothetical protein [Chitinophagaceae bacterium]
MKEFLFIFRGGDAGALQGSPEAMQQHTQKWINWMQKLAADGKMIGGQPLSTDGKVLTGKNKKITDGPYAEGKELIGGYLLVHADNYDEAVEISKDCPGLELDGSVEIRQIQEIQM